ncbi:glycosyltransferase family 4 protein [Vibrio aestuarianus]|uniref:Glycosyltransferase family 4 protein n=1 Tax=Vibrio aestuarianus TaxID=28171 RepID=A0A9X4FHG3_9VIBR|nr:glycosyltransferase family 4 protein [Vibrio aestuarianus]MDE1358707.1 glycosyltransferase family 4 protein [Vibrio aestuarianus]
MKVLYLVNCSNFFRTHFVNLAISVKDQGHEVCIAAGNDIQKEYLESLGFSFVLIPLSRSGKGIVDELVSITAIFRLIQKFSPDYIHTFTIKPVLYGGIVCKIFSPFRKTKTISSITGLGSASMAQSRKGKILWAFLKLFYRCSLSGNKSKVLFENEDDRRFFLDSKIVTRDQTAIINGAGVDVNEFSPRSPSSSLISVVFVARLLRDKGVEEYIRAGEILRELNVPVELLLIGSTDPNNPSSMDDEDIAEANEKKYIRALGFRTDIAKCYQNSHIACLPSYREGLPKSLIEAAACGLPIITTDVPGCRQMVHNGRNGVLVPAKNSRALAMAIKDLVEDPIKRIKMGQESRKIAESKYSNEMIIESFFRVYGFKGQEKNE